MAFLAPALAGATTLQKVSMALSAFSAVMKVKEGMDTKKAYKTQAAYAELEGRVEAVKAKEQGTEQLKNTIRALASVSATAYAGGLEPTIGTPQDIGTFNVLNPGINDFITSKDNEAIALSSAAGKAADLKAAGNKAMTGALISAGTSLASTGLQLSSIGQPGSYMVSGYTDNKGLGVA